MTRLAHARTVPLAPLLSLAARALGIGLLASALAGCGESGGANCPSSCATEGETVCAQGAVSRCTTDLNGCLKWGPAQSCPQGFCADASSCGTCSNACPQEGDAQCSAGQARACVADGNGCLTWGPTQSCPQGFCADASRCGTCSNTCPQEGDTRCAVGQAQACVADAQGCLSWSAPSGCADGFCASASTCGTCANTCPTAGATQCVSGQIKTCRADAHGCRAWSAATACAGGFCSSASACGTCNHACATVGATTCAGGQLRSCVADANGCRSWGAATACSTGSCSSATACANCTNGCPTGGATQCTGGQLSTCAAAAGGCLAWGTAAACASAVCGSSAACDLRPVAALSCPATVKVGVAAAFDGSASTDADGTVASYAFTFGDGASRSASPAATAQHAFAAAGTFTVTLTVADAQGATGQATCTVRVAAAPVVISEILYRATGTDYDVFVELHGPPGTDLSTYTLVGVNGTDGLDYSSLALSGAIPSDGSYVVAHPSAKAAILSQADLTSTKVDYQNGPDSVQLRLGTLVVDAVGYGTFAASDVFAGEGTPAPNTADDQSLSRNAACDDTDVNAVDFHVASTPTPGFPDGAANQPPTAALACPAAGVVGQPLTFSGAGSTDPDGAVVTYALTFGDGSAPLSGAAPSAQHTFAAAGTFTVTLTVTDNLGATGQATCAVPIAVGVNQAPAARLTCPSTGTPGQGLTFDGSASTDADGTIASYAFAFGDGTAPATGAASSAQHAFAATGSYSVTLTVTDNGGATAQATCAVAIALANLVISANRELCGEQRLGQLTIQGGAKVTCATGALTVYADDISIDPASSIDLSATSTSWSGESYNFAAPFCAIYVAYTGAGGGGNHTAGGTAASCASCAQGSTSGVCVGSCANSFTASGAHGGGARGSLDLDAPLGGAGGSGCRYPNGYYGTCATSDVLAGGRGGGAVKLIAARRMTISGRVLADGEAGKDGNAGSGGGAGGSIVLASPDLALTGTLSVRGGLGGAGVVPSYYASSPATGGAGGEGWIKIARGTSYSNTATVAGAAAVVSSLPPLTITSSTHPDPALAYNDDFASFAVAWAAPFTGAQGTWSALGASWLDVTPANATYGTGRSASFPRSSFTWSGEWAFSAVSTDASGAAGTLANRFRVWINATPHAVASTSHPSSTTWYPGTAIALSWTPPSSTTASSFPAFWYRLDRTSNTSPANAKAQWTRTTNPQVTLTQDSSGQPISGFAYYFHLVSEDTQGNLTSSAAHFLVQVGAQPAALSFFGYVKDGAGTAVNGAQVRLEPYGLTATTDLNGYFLLTNVLQGPYTISVAKAGFTTSSAPVTVDAAASPWNGTLAP